MRCRAVPEENPDLCDVVLWSRGRKFSQSLGRHIVLLQKKLFSTKSFLLSELVDQRRSEANRKSHVISYFFRHVNSGACHEEATITRSRHCQKERLHGLFFVVYRAGPSVPFVFIPPILIAPGKILDCEK